MCQVKTNTPNILQLAVPRPAERPTGPAVQASHDGGSRRRRLWELNDHAHCPVIGVCMPLHAMRKLVARVTPTPLAADDYDLHCIVVSDSKRRNPLSEAVQKELDLRHATAIRQAAKIKCSEALLHWWRDAVEGPNLAEALWVTLTHPRCNADIEYKVLGHVHMLQHQVGMACRVDLARFESLLQENSILARHLATAQDRCTRLGAEHATRTEAMEAALMRARADVLARDTTIEQLHAQIMALQAASPDLPARLALSQDKRDLTEQNQALRRQLHQAEHEVQRHQARADDALARQRQASMQARQADRQAAKALAPAPSLGNRAVLCVGGRPAVVPIYRQVIEHTGGRFLHHDGGEEDNTAQLDATLAAADLVICQTGCVSHNAYWRVKDHCKRTGKRCVFVDTPSRSALTRALDEVARTLDQAPQIADS